MLILTIENEVFRIEFLFKTHLLSGFGSTATNLIEMVGLKSVFL